MEWGTFCLVFVVMNCYLFMDDMCIYDVFLYEFKYRLFMPANVYLTFVRLYVWNRSNNSLFVSI